MAFGLSPIRFLRRPSEVPLLSAGPEKAVECWIELDMLKRLSTLA